MSTDTTYPLTLRRRRQNPKVHSIFETVDLKLSQMIVPLFYAEELKPGDKREVGSFQGQFQHSYETLIAEMENCVELGLFHFLLFVVPKEKQAVDHMNFELEYNLTQKIKKHFKDEIVLSVDVCLCSHTHSGHCGVLKNGKIENHSSVELLTQRAKAFALGGADILAPSDMLDSRILAFRQMLAAEDKLNPKAHLSSTMIMSYSTKFSSAFYGPFRDAANSTPSEGDRSSYQINYANPEDALMSSLRDFKEGSDILMVKPAQNYLDIIYRIKDHPELKDTPLAAYQVSGEYRAFSLLAGGDEEQFKKLLNESLIALKRAGSDLIITYGAKYFAQHIYRK